MATNDSSVDLCVCVAALAMATNDSSVDLCVCVAALNNSKSSKVPINSECDQSNDHKTSKYSNHSVC